jgi:hypothetical protein
MNRNTAHFFKSLTKMLAFALLFTLAASRHTLAQTLDAKSPYPTMAPVEQYLMDRDAEIAMARSAAPASISSGAGVLVLGRHGYETAAKGNNGFVCIVQRSWTGGIDDPDFWNPKIRAPICYNPPAVRTYLPLAIKKTELVLAGKSKTQMFNEVSAELDKRELPSLEPGAMCYMMSTAGYLNDRDGHWHPHLMFFLPQSDEVTWGADLPGSPILGFKDNEDRLSVYVITVGKWSDGTPAPADHH